MPISDFDRIGGSSAVRTAVDRFYERVVADSELAPYFVDVDMVKLKRHQVLMLSQVLGGPANYDGRDLASAHGGLGITVPHYDRVVGHLAGVLVDLGAGPDIMARAGAVLTEVRPQIVTAPAGTSDHSVGNA